MKDDEGNPTDSLNRKLHVATSFTNTIYQESINNTQQHNIGNNIMCKRNKPNILILNQSVI